MEDAGKLVDQLCTVAGMVFEDTLDAALLRSASGTAAARAAMIEAAANDAVTLARAAAVIVARYG